MQNTPLADVPVAAEYDPVSKVVAVNLSKMPSIHGTNIILDLGEFQAATLSSGSA